MFTPQEIEEKTFVKAVFGGYDMASVDEFLEPLTEDYIALYKENAVLKSKMKILVEKLEEYRTQEDSMKKALVAAQKTSDTMVAEAEKKCAQLTSQAENIVRTKIQESQQQISAEEDRIERAKQAARNFIEIIEKDVARHLDLLNNLKLMNLGPQPSASSFDFHAEPQAPKAETVEPITVQLPVDKIREAEAQQESEAEDSRSGLPRIAIVGKPNVGKSSLTNALLGEERNIVTPVAGTTRDSIETYYNKFGYEFMLVDTAGIRRKAKVREDLEFYSVMRSIRAIEHSDICILMIDATAGMEAQDMNIFNLIARNRKGCVVVVNKWDLFIKDSNTMREYESALKERLAPFNDIPIVFTSVVRKQRIQDVLDAATRVFANYTRKIPTARLNEALLPVIEETPPPAWKGKYVKVKYITQLPTRFPAFAFFCNLPQYIKEPYKRFLENQLRRNFDLSGCPVQIYCRQK